MKLYRNLFVVLLVGVGLLSVPFQASAQTASFTFVKIADNTSTNVPGGSMTARFHALLWPVLDGTDVAFLGISLGGPGIYRYAANNLEVVADANTTIPGTSDAFSTLAWPLSIDGGKVAFYGASADRQQRGIYTDAGGSLQVVANQGTAVPETAPPVLFSDFRSPLSLDNGSVAFLGMGISEGIYTGVGGNLTVVADTNTPIPSPGASGNFTRFNSVSQDQNVVAFNAEGSGGQKGI